VNQNKDELKEAWARANDADVIRAATQGWNEYSSKAQNVIDDEVRKRELTKKVNLILSEQPREAPRLEEEFRCELCKGTNLNIHTGRCAACEYPSDQIGYCIHCDEFYPFNPGRVCPVHKTNLGHYKAAMNFRRFVNDYLGQNIRFIPVFLLMSLLAKILNLTYKELFNYMGAINISLCIFISYYLYYFIFETLWQRTPGKYITGTKVVTSSGGKPSIGAIAIRTIVRFIPFESFSFLGSRAYGWHDVLSGTYVIKAKRFTEKKDKLVNPTEK
jgi:uncharacterized RDD family membrane protein YckC